MNKNTKPSKALVKTDVSGCSGYLKIGLSDLYKTQNKLK